MGISGAKILALTVENSSFSKTVPGLQVAVDSTSMGNYKECAYKYFLINICGYAPRHTRIALEFGILYHKCLEIFDKELAKGTLRDKATLIAVRYAMENFGYRLDSKFYPHITKDTTRTRYTLVRAIVWYVAEYEDDNLETIILKNGKPAIELSFRMPFEDYLICGHIDRMARIKSTNTHYIIDRKTTKTTLSSGFFKRFSPDNQMSTYSVAGDVVWHERVSGMLIEACQVAVGFSRFERGFATRTKGSLDEWLNGLSSWLGKMKLDALALHWPMNDKSCNNYGGCEFRKFCSQDPGVRMMFLAKEFTKRIWDPLKPR